MSFVNEPKIKVARVRNWAVLALALFGSVFVAASVNAANEVQGNGPEGTWLVRVFVSNPPNGFPVPFDALETYGRGGSLVTSNNNPLIPRPGHGTWTKDGNEHAVRIIFFLFDPTGVPVGTVEVTHRFQIDGELYRGAGEAQFKDQEGNPLFPEHPQPFTFITQGKRLV